MFLSPSDSVQDLLLHTAIGIAFLAGLLAAPATRAQTPDPADIAEGMRLFLQKGNCQA